MPTSWTQWTDLVLEKFRIFFLHNGETTVLKACCFVSGISSVLNAKERLFKKMYNLLHFFFFMIFLSKISPINCQKRKSKSLNHDSAKCCLVKLKELSGLRMEKMIQKRNLPFYNSMGEK